MAVRNSIIILGALIFAAACHSISSKQRYSNLFADAVTKIDDYALVETSERQLFDWAMEGMLSSLDPNSAYISGRDFEALEQRLRQEFGGIGMYVDVNPETSELTVTSPVPNSPAMRAGIQSGDIIETIDGALAKDFDRNEAIQRMRGPVGQTLRLTIRRPPDDRVIPLTLTREMIPTQSVLGDARQVDGSWEYFLPEDSRVAYLNIA